MILHLGNMLTHFITSMLDEKINVTPVPVGQMCSARQGTLSLADRLETVGKHERHLSPIQQSFV